MTPSMGFKLLLPAAFLLAACSGDTPPPETGVMLRRNFLLVIFPVPEAIILEILEFDGQLRLFLFDDEVGEEFSKEGHRCLAREYPYPSRAISMAGLPCHLIEVPAELILESLQ